MSLLCYAVYNCYPCARSKVLPMWPVCTSMRTLQKRALARRVTVYGDPGFAVCGDLDLPHPLRPQSNPFRQPFNPRHRRPQPRFVDRFGHVGHIRRMDRLTYNQRQLALIQRGNLGQR